MTREEHRRWLIKMLTDRSEERDYYYLNDKDKKVIVEALKEPERKKGQWEDFECGNSYRCTSCGEIWTLNDGTPAENNMNYCPKCGADMRGEQK